MMLIIIGILAGIAVPMQTGFNGRLRVKMGSPYYASLISFTISLIFLSSILLITGQGIGLPFAEIAKEPLWIWCGGLCGVVFLTGNILLLANLDGVQTVILPVLGQILMGLVIDSFGLFKGTKVTMSGYRVIGAILVIAGVVIVSLAKSIEKDSTKIDPGFSKPGKWFWRTFGVCAGMLTAMQAAFNGRLGKVIESPAKATLVSFLVGCIALLAICMIITIKDRGMLTHVSREKTPWWIWVGGILGAIYIFGNITLSVNIGVGTTVILILTGSTTGGLVIDHFGLFGCKKKPITVRKIIGIIIMITGAALIKLF